jgi:hypothetical protein
MVAVAALFGDQLGEAAGMVGRAGGVLMHGAVLDGGDVLQAVVGEDPEAGRLLEQDGGVAEDQAVDGLGLSAEDGHGGRGAAGVVEVAGVGVEGGHVGDRLGQAVGWGTVGLGAEQSEELGAELAGEPGRAMDTTGGKPCRYRGAVDHHDNAGRGGDEILVADGVWRRA